MIVLQYGVRRTQFKIPDSGWLSHGKASEHHQFVHDAGLSTPFDSLFIKRYKGKRAPAHDLLKTLCEENHMGKSIPLFFGMEEDSQHQCHYYAFQLLKMCQPFSNYAHNIKVPHDKKITYGFVSNLINCSGAAFRLLNKHNFYYGDYCFENLLVNYERFGAFLIDIDSAYPFTVLQNETCSKTWWTLYYAWNLHDARYINQTMIMSLALVLCKALTELQVSGEGANAAQTLKAKPADQRLLFNLFDDEDAPGIKEMFSVPKRYTEMIYAALESWSFQRNGMEASKQIGWRKSLEFTTSMLNLVAKERRKSGKDKAKKTKKTQAQWVASKADQQRWDNEIAKLIQKIQELDIELDKVARKDDNETISDECNICGTSLLVNCPKCSGSGQVRRLFLGPRTCPRCNGSRRIKMRYCPNRRSHPSITNSFSNTIRQRTTCPKCHGAGYLLELTYKQSLGPYARFAGRAGRRMVRKYCPRCGGKGVV